MGEILHRPGFDAERLLLRAFLANDVWRPSRQLPIQIRGSFLASLIAGAPRADWISRESGLAASSLRVENDLQIDGGGHVEIIGGICANDVSVARNVRLDSLIISGPVEFNNVRLGSLEIRDCILSGAFSGRSLEVDRDLLISMRPVEKWRLDEDSRNAGTEGSILEVDGHFEAAGPKFDKIDLTNCRIGGSAYFFRLNVANWLGLTNADIAGDLIFGKGHDRINDVGRVEVAGRDGQRAGVDLSGANIRGNVDLRGLTITGRASEDGVAFEMRHAEVGGSVKLGASERPDSSADEFGAAKNGVRKFLEVTTGSVLIHTSAIKGDLQCSGAFLGGFNEEFFNSLSIYNCKIGGKLGIARFRCSATERPGYVDNMCGAQKHVPIAEAGNNVASAGGWGLGAPLIFSCARPGAISPRIVVFQCHAAILEVGQPSGCHDGDGRGASDHGNWRLFDIEANQLTLSATTYERLEESTLKSEDWAALLSKNTRFTDRHLNICERYKYPRINVCSCQKAAVFDADIWTQAARVLEREGMDDAARSLRYQREQRLLADDRRRLNENRRVDWAQRASIWSRTALSWFVGHGFEPQRFFGHLVFGVFLGACIFQGSYCSELLRQIGASEPLRCGAPVGAPKLFPFIYALEVFLPVLEFEQTNHWRPHSMWVAAAEVFLSIYGWLAATLAGLSFTTLFKRV